MTFSFQRFTKFFVFLMAFSAFSFFVSPVEANDDLPDLIISNAVISDTFDANKNALATVKICNQGTTTFVPIDEMNTEAGMILFSYKTNAVPLPLGLKEPLAAGECQWNEASLLNLPSLGISASGYHPYITVSVDSENIVEESNELNNERTLHTWIDFSEGSMIDTLPDLIIEDVEFLFSTDSNRVFHFAVTIRNKGIVDATSEESSVRLNVSANNAPLDYKFFPVNAQDTFLKAKAEQTFTIEVNGYNADGAFAFSDKPHEFIFHIDSSNSIKEADEQNNKFKVPFPFEKIEDEEGLPDLVIENMKITKIEDTISHPATIKIEGDILNIGTALLRDEVLVAIYTDDIFFGYLRYSEKDMYGNIIPFMPGEKHHLTLYNLTPSVNKITFVANKFDEWVSGLFPVGYEYESIEELNEENNSTTVFNDIDTNDDDDSEYEDEVITESFFPDTAPSSREGIAAKYLREKNIIGGFPDGEFKGDRDVNRAELSKFLLLAKGINVGNLQNDGHFPDVLEGEWYVKYVIKAAEQGIVNGNPDGSFRPADTVNTAEFLKMITETFGIKKNMAYHYNDAFDSDWFGMYAGVAEKYELFPHRDSKYLEPARKLTRNEVAVAIHRYLTYD